MYRRKKLRTSCEVTWIIYEIKGEPRKRSEIPDDKWRTVIAQENAMIIVDKNKKSMYILI
jgi:hypothetical protein